MKDSGGSGRNRILSNRESLSENLFREWPDKVCENNGETQREQRALSSHLCLLFHLSFIMIFSHLFSSCYKLYIYYFETSYIFCCSNLFPFLAPLVRQKTTRIPVSKGDRFCRLIPFGDVPDASVSWTNSLRCLKSVSNIW